MFPPTHLWVSQNLTDNVIYDENGKRVDIKPNPDGSTTVGQCMCPSCRIPSSQDEREEPVCKLCYEAKRRLV